MQSKKRPTFFCATKSSCSPFTTHSSLRCTHNTHPKQTPPTTWYIHKESKKMSHILESPIHEEEYSTDDDDSTLDHDSSSYSPTQQVHDNISFSTTTTHPLSQVNRMRRILERDLRRAERESAQRRLHYDQTGESTLLLETLATQQGKPTTTTTAHPLDDSHHTAAALQQADAMFYDTTLCDAEADGNGLYTAVTQRPPRASTASSRQGDSTPQKEAAAAEILSGVNNATRTVTTRCSAGSSSVHNLPYVVSRKTEVCDVALSPTPTSLSPERKLGQVVAHQEKQMRGLVAALQSAAAEIKRERRSRAEVEEALYHAKRRRPEATQEARPEKEKKEKSNAALLVALRVENEALRDENASLSAILAERDAETPSRLHEERNLLRSDVEAMQEQLSAGVQEIEVWRTRFTNAEEEIQKLTACIVSMEAEVEAVTAEEDEEAEEAEEATNSNTDLEDARTDATSEFDEDAYLRDRMKRALAPRPDPEALAILINSMVTELKKEWRKLCGRDLPLKRSGVNGGKGCVYEYREKRLNLRIVAGKLAFRAGGGHTVWLLGEKGIGITP